MASIKKLMVPSTPLKKGMDSGEAQKTMAVLENGIKLIYERKESELSFEQHHSYGYKLVINKHGDLLYNSLVDIVIRYLKPVVDLILVTPNEVLLQTLSKAWNDHKLVYSVIRDIMMYMDRTYVQQHRKRPFYDMATILFRNEVFYHPIIRERVRTVLIQNTELERQGCVIDRIVLKDILSMFSQFSIDGINVYEEDFERPFLMATRAYYQVESSDYITHNTAYEYVIKAENRFLEETQRVQHYLFPSTEPKLKQILEYEYITTHVKTIIDMEYSGIIYYMRNDRYMELKKVYQVLSYVPNTLDYMRDAIGNYIKTHGYEIIADQDTVKDPLLFVQQMIDFKIKLDMIIKDCFHQDKKIYKKIKDAYEDIMNKDNRCAQYLSQYVDELLKSGGTIRITNESEIELYLQRIIILFKYLNDKDIFEYMYRNHLSKRLLNNKSISDEYEKLMITKLKNECGQQYTSKLEGMFLDMSMSKEIMDNFKNSTYYTQIRSYDMEVQTLTASHWNMKAVTMCQLPSEIMTGCHAFTQYYNAKYQTGRKLTWLTHIGSADIKATFASGKHELNVSTYQMCILLLFNDKITLSLDQIRQSLCGIPETELRRHLLSLCTPKLRILKKSSTGKGIEDDDIITFNHEFTSKFKRIKIPLISVKEIVLEENDIIPTVVEEDRKHIVEAAIVRIMKSRKRITHMELIAETTRQLSTRFQPTPLFIKKRIESLIEREYVARDRDDNRYYQYMA